MDPHPTAPTADPGTVLTIDSGPYSAQIGTRGAALRALTHNGRDLVVPQTEDLSLLAYSGRILAPWPNRLAGGTYTWEGQAYRVPVNERATDTALHGLLAWTDFTPDQPDAATVALLAVVEHEGYPTTLEVRVTYHLGDDGLTTRVTATNTGARSAPYGVSHHPYLTIGAPVDRAVLTLPATRVLRTTERLLPAGLDDVSGTLDLRAPVPFGSRSVDHAFTGLPERWEARLADEEGFAVVVGSDAPWCQVYSGEEIGRRGAAVEPMTCPPDAFNTGDGLVELAPGESHEFAFTIRAER